MRQANSKITIETAGPSVVVIGIKTWTETPITGGLIDPRDEASVEYLLVRLRGKANTWRLRAVTGEVVVDFECEDRWLAVAQAMDALDLPGLIGRSSPSTPTPPRPIEPGDFMVENFDFSSTEVMFIPVSDKAKAAFVEAFGPGVVNFTTSKSHAQDVLDRFAEKGLKEILQ
jgi:hypothetical protein